jgi:RimJ/RimL family protein N-acetyltransferase
MPDADVLQPRVHSSSNQPEIEVGDHFLRPWRLSDTAKLIEASQDPGMHTWNEMNVTTTRDAREWISYWADRWRKESGASWAIVSASAPETAIGCIALRTWYPEDRLAECSYWVLPDHRGSGIVARAARALWLWASNELDLHRLEIAHSVRNRSSCRAATKAGFASEGIKRTLQPDAHHKYHDMHMHACVQRADVRAGPLDRALVGFVSHKTMWPAALCLSITSAVLAIMSPFAIGLMIGVLCALLIVRFTISDQLPTPLRRARSSDSDVSPT